MNHVPAKHTSTNSAVNSAVALHPAGGNAQTNAQAGAALSLTDDDVALLRFTCDLFFVEESPLYPIEAKQKEPSNYEQAYHRVVDKKIVDPYEFRITDAALNRLAPVTECDGRIIHLVQPYRGMAQQTDYYLLDEITVPYALVNKQHLFGLDMDQNELVEHLTKRFIPRRSGGDRVEVVLTPLEFLTLALLAEALRTPARESIRAISLRQAQVLLSKHPSPQATLPMGNAMLAMSKMRNADDRSKRGVHNHGNLVNDATWNSAILGLLEKGVLRRELDALIFRPAIADLVRGLLSSTRHTLIRYDFGPREWYMRETTFVPVDGSLFAIGPKPGMGLHIQELDYKLLSGALAQAVGPLPKRSSKTSKIAAPPRLNDLLGRR